MADLLKTAIVAGVVHKVLSKKKKSDKSDEKIRYRYSRGEKELSKNVYIFFTIFFTLAGILSLVSGIMIKGLGLFIGLGVICILYAVMLYFEKIKKST